MGGLRADQVALTRQRVIDAVVELTAEAGAELTVAEVARRSGISPATIYRHFPTRDDLVSAAANDRILLGVPAETDQFGAEQLRAHLLALWTDLTGNLTLARQASVSVAGRELRQARFDAFKPLYDRAMREGGVDPDSEDGRRFSACAHLLSSAHALLDLHDRQGLSAEEAVEVVAWAIDVLMAAVGLDPAQFHIPIGRAIAREEDIA
jgi:AcrR family transcriptional regulator